MLKYTGSVLQVLIPWHHPKSPFTTQISAHALLLEDGKKGPHGDTEESFGGMHGAEGKLSPGKVNRCKHLQNYVTKVTASAWASVNGRDKEKKGSNKTTSSNKHGNCSNSLLSLSTSVFFSRLPGSHVLLLITGVLCSDGGFGLWSTGKERLGGAMPTVPLGAGSLV